MSGAAVQRLDGVTNRGAVTHDLRSDGLGIEQLVQGVIVAGDVAIGPGEVELVRDRPLGRQVGRPTTPGPGWSQQVVRVSRATRVFTRLLLRVDEAGRRLNLGRTVMYELIRSGRLRSVKVGKRRLIPTSALVEFVDQLGGAA